MTRQEQIAQAAKKYIKDIVTPLPASLMTAFVKGAIYADEHPDLYSVTRKAVERERKHLIDKICEWLEHRQLVDLEVPNIEKFINDFRKNMEEQQ